MAVEVGRMSELAGRWEIDPTHSSVNFAVKHMMISTVRGRFRDVQGWFTLGEHLADVRVEATIGTASIYTGDDERDEDLRSGNFLEASRYPEIHFRSTRVEQTSDDEGGVVGELTIKDVTRPVVLDVRYQGFAARDTSGHPRIAFSAAAAIDRREFGITWNRVLDTGGVLVGETVRIELDIAAIRRESVGA